MIVSNLKNIFKDTYEENITKVMEVYGFDIVKCCLLIITARRMGKSIAVGMMLAINMLCIAFITQAVFASATRMAKTMIDIVHSFAIHFPAYKRMTSITLGGRRAAETIILVGSKPGDRRILRAYPNKVGK